MDAQEQNLVQLVSALPDQFEFYHLGKVVQQPSGPMDDFLESLDGEISGVAFRLYGEMNGVILVFFESGLDHSTYSELGNLLASRMATRLRTENGLDVMISPPQKIDHQRLLALSRGNQPYLRRTYAHFIGNSTIFVETLVLSAPSEGIGYA